MAAPVDVEALVEDVQKGRRSALGRAITLIESRREVDRNGANALVAALMPHAGRSQRVGITGVPGVGKSTLIEGLGSYLTGRGHRVAVLAVDPSSARSGGSILGDKTRMAKLARDPNAFIRPSPAAGALGGVARRTRETIVVCEAAGYDVVLVETVGVGQSEVMVADMVDFFLVLTLAGGGDELQGIKRGILELADLLAITKADGDNVDAARRARQAYAQALSLFPPRFDAWTPPVTTCSAMTGEGVPELWEAVTQHRAAMDAAGRFEMTRREQNLRWMWRTVEEALVDSFRADAGVKAVFDELRGAVLEGRVPPEQAAERMMAAYRRSN